MQLNDLFKKLLNRFAVRREDPSEEQITEMRIRNREMVLDSFRDDGSPYSKEMALHAISYDFVMKARITMQHRALQQKKQTLMGRPRIKDTTIGKIINIIEEFVAHEPNMMAFASASIQTMVTTDFEYQSSVNTLSDDDKRAIWVTNNKKDAKQYELFESISLLEHTLHILEEFKAYADYGDGSGSSTEEKMLLCLCCFFHDFGKNDKTAKAFDIDVEEKKKGKLKHEQVSCQIINAIAAKFDSAKILLDEPYVGWIEQIKYAISCHHMPDYAANEKTKMAEELIVLDRRTRALELKNLEED